MKNYFIFIFITISQLLKAQNCPIEGEIAFLKSNYIHDTLCSIDVKVSFKNSPYNQIYLLIDTGRYGRVQYERFNLLKDIPTGCFDSTKRDLYKYGLEYYILDSIGNVVETDIGYPILKLWKEEANSYYENIDKPSKVFNALTISKALGLPLKYVYEPMVWNFFYNYLNITPILPLHTHSVIYSLKVKSLAAKLKPDTKYYLHVLFCADEVAKDMNEYLTPQLEIEVLSIAYKFEPIMFRLPGIKQKK